MFDIILNVLLLTSPDSQFVYLKEIVHQENYELVELLKINPYKIKDQPSYHYYKAITAYKLMHKEESLKHIDFILEGFDTIPDRYMVLCEKMKNDMLTWKNDDLGNISRKMDNIERKLKLERTGEDTQKLQKEVINDLDKLIKNLEDKKIQAEEQTSKTQEKPLEESDVKNDIGQGIVDNKKLKQLVGNWGKLPEKERAKAMELITKDLPAKHRELIEKYFKELSKSITKN